MNKTKIEWCDSTWNPVTGCYHNCEYCYARKIATRFGGNDKLSTFRYGQKDWHRADNNKDMFCDEASREKPMLFVVDKPLYLPSKFDKRATEKYGRQIFKCKKAPYPFDFNPTFHRHKLDEPQKWTTPRTIFVCSMADLFGAWVPDEWIEEVFEVCESAPQHNYMFLTKNPKRYEDLIVKDMLPLKDNMWFGTSITTRDDSFIAVKNSGFHTFVSIEPLLERFPTKAQAEEKGLSWGLSRVEWVIIGAETGNRADKVIPKREWIESLVIDLKSYNIPVFMKDSLIPIVGEENMLREFPEGLRKDKEND